MLATLTHKTKLAALLLLLVALIVLHQLLGASADTGAQLTFEWHFWLPLFVGMILVAYALSIRCPVPTCGRKQVFRGYSVFDLRWPGERCYYCHAPLNATQSDGSAP